MNMKTLHKVSFALLLPLVFGYLAIIYTSSPACDLTRRKPLTDAKVYYAMHHLLEGGTMDTNHNHDNQTIWKVIPRNLKDRIHGNKGVRLTVTPPLVANGDDVMVEWSGVPDPSPRKSSDWIGLYCPSHSPSSRIIDFWWVRELVDNPQEHGRSKFTLYNARMDCQFRYFINDTTTQLVAISNTIHFIDSQKAHLHIHLALTGDSSEMRVQWTTGKKCVPTVHYGMSPHNLNFKATGSSKTYKASDMCGPPANMSSHFIPPGYLHDVLLSGLTPDTQYYYRVSGTGLSSEVKTFRSALPPGDSVPFTFLVYGDMDITSNSDVTAANVLADVEHGGSFVLHIGDLSYAVGLAYRWEEWMSLIEPISSLVPYMVSIGNHEQCHFGDHQKDPSGSSFHPAWGNYLHDSGGECGVPVAKRFHMPDNGNGVWWYNFEYGHVHIVQLSTEHSLSPGSLQFTWLENVFRSVDRERTPWLIVTGHRPMYNSEKYISDFNVSLHLRENLEDLLHEYRVDLFIAGHYHSYERICRVYKERCVDDGTVHVTVGSAGMVLDNGEHWDVEWSKHFEISYGFGRVSVANRTALLWEFVRNKDKAVSDHTWLRK